MKVLLSDEGNCPNGSNNCDFTGAHELALTKEIMGMIGRYRQDGHIDRCPLCLRDTMLAVAALLHLEAATVARAKSRKTAVGGKSIIEEFTEAASERLEAVIGASPARVARSKH
jgi:hypothetical protein